MKNKKGLALLSGVLFFLSFPPFPFGFLAPIALTLLLHIVKNTNRKEAFKYAFLSGVVFNIGLLYWIPRLMAEGLYVVLAIGMVLLIAYLAAWVGLVGWLTRIAWDKNKSLGLFLFPVIWVAQEKARELGEMSFPWVTSGYSFGSYIPLIQFLAWGGVYFYSLLISVTAVLLFLLFDKRNDKGMVKRISLILLSIYGLLIAFGWFRIHSAKPDAPTITVAMVQANVDQNIKWDNRFTDSVVQLHQTLSRSTLSEKPDLLVWSESAMPFYFLKRYEYREEIRRFLDSIGIPVIFGSLDYERNPKKEKHYNFFNSAFFYDPAVGEFQKYDKIRLVPFSEALPFEGFFPIISRVDLGEADFQAGDSLTLFSLWGKPFFTPICYEVVYPDFIRTFANRGGRFMVHITNDGWFGRSGMPFQHANITRFRAVENGMPVAQCANTGVSCFIDIYGRMKAATDIFTTTTLTHSLSFSTAPTFYTQHGDWVGWACLYMVPLFIFGSFLYEKRC